MLDLDALSAQVSTDLSYVLKELRNSVKELDDAVKLTNGDPVKIEMIHKAGIAELFQKAWNAEDVFQAKLVKNADKEEIKTLIVACSEAYKAIATKIRSVLDFGN